MVVDHIGIAVRSLDQAIATYGTLLGLSVGEREELDSDGVRIAFLGAGNLTLELLEARGDGPILRFLTERGEGLHHLAFRVDDIADALARAKAGGYRLVDEVPRRGARGKLVAFLHPKTTHGVLIEYVQAPPSSQLRP